MGSALHATVVVDPNVLHNADKPCSGMYLKLVGDEPAVSSNHRLLNQIPSASAALFVNCLATRCRVDSKGIASSSNRIRDPASRTAGFGCRCGGRGSSRESVGNGPNTCGHTVGMYPRGASDGPPTDDGIRARPWWVYRRLSAPLSTRATIFAGRAHRIPTRVSGVYPPCSLASGTLPRESFGGKNRL